MARRPKKTAAEDSVNFVAMFPWWVGVAIAVVSYVVLHRVAVAPAPTLTNTQQLGQFGVSVLLTGVAKFAQYLIPALALLGSLVSFLKRGKRKALLARAASGETALEIDRMSWQEFELLIGEAFRQRGYTVVETGQNGPDGGIDLVLRKGVAKGYVQCKQSRRALVGIDVVRAHYGVMQADGVKFGFVVASGRFSDEAIKFASKVGVELIDGASLQVMLRKAKGALPSAQLQPVRQRAQQKAVDPEVTQAAPQSNMQRAAGDGVNRAMKPACPICYEAMIKRTVRKGDRAGQPFWGCSGYPACKGMRSID